MPTPASQAARRRSALGDRPSRIQGGLWLLARARGRRLVNAARSFRRHSMLKLAVVATAGLAFWLGVLAAAYYGFCFINRYLGLGEPELLTETLLSLFFLLLAAMLLFSNAIISFGSLFRSAETEFLLACPVRPESVFAYRLIESLTFSSWAFLALGFPLLLGYGLSVGVNLPPQVLAPSVSEVSLAAPRFFGSLELSPVTPWYFPLVILAYFVPFVVLPAALGATVAVVLAAYLPDQVKRVLGLTVVAGLVVAVSLVLWVHGAVESGAALSEGWLRRALGRMSFSRNLFLPNYWVTQGLLQCAQGRLAEAGYWLLVLASNAALGLVLCGEAGRRLLRRAWSRSRSHSGMRRRASGRWALARWAPPLRLLVAKDWRLFARDPVQWSQCAILFGLMGFYVLNLRTFAYHRAQAQWRDVTALLNLAATSLVLATVTTRFIFPMVSLEGRRFWLLGLAPVSRRMVLWSKFVLAFCAALVVTVPLIVLSGYMLKLSADRVWHHTAMTVFVCFGVSGLSVGLGAVYPNWREENPAKIVSGFGGTLNLLVSIAFVLVLVALTVLPYLARVAGLAGGWRAIVLGVGLSCLLSLAAGLVPMHLGHRALRRLEF